MGTGQDERPGETFHRVSDPVQFAPMVKRVIALDLSWQLSLLPLIRVVCQGNAIKSPSVRFAIRFSYLCERKKMAREDQQSDLGPGSSDGVFRLMGHDYHQHRLT